MRSERKQLEPENNAAKNVGHQSDGVEKSKAEILNIDIGVEFI